MARRREISHDYEFFGFSLVIPEEKVMSVRESRNKMHFREIIYKSYSNDVIKNKLKNNLLVFQIVFRFIIIKN